MTAREYFENYMHQQNPCVRLARQSAAVGGQYRSITVERAWKTWGTAWMCADHEAKKQADLLHLPVIDPDLLDTSKEATC